MASKQFVIFDVSGESYGVEITQVIEIIKPLEIFKVPNTPEFIEGLINLRGHTIFNLRKRFSMPSKQFDENTKIIIVSVDSLQIGFIVDEVNEIIRVDDENIEETPQAFTGLDKKYLNGVAKVGDKIILLLDLSSVLTVQEENDVKKFAETL